MDESSPSPSGRRAILSVPGTDTRVIGKALASGADEVVIDLEDSVPVAGKAEARERLIGFPWGEHPRPRSVAVRVNAPGTPWFVADVEALVRRHVSVDSIVLPKVESRDDVRFAERLVDGLEREVGVPARLRLQALIETARGVSALADIVRDRERLDSLIIGYADLAASLGRGSAAGDASWLPVQSAVLVHARSAGMEAVDGPHLTVAVDDGFMDSVSAAAALGFDAKWAIHPRQVKTLADAFYPSDAEIERARRVLDALEAAAGDGRGAVQLDGALVDEAMAVDARRVVARASR